MSCDAIADAAMAATYGALGLTATWVPAYGIVAEVRAADLPPGSPADNDQLLLGSRRWRVRSARYKDANMLVWLLDCVPA